MGQNERKTRIKYLIRTGAKNIKFKVYQKTLAKSTNTPENGKHCSSTFFFVFNFFFRIYVCSFLKKTSCSKYIRRLKAKSTNTLKNGEHCSSNCFYFRIFS